MCQAGSDAWQSQYSVFNKKYSERVWWLYDINLTSPGKSANNLKCEQILIYKDVIYYDHEKKGNHLTIPQIGGRAKEILVTSKEKILYSK